MALDRFVNWPTREKVPTRADLSTMLRDFFRGSGARVRWRSDRFFVTLPGYCSHPLRRLAPVYQTPEWERWIEVHIGTKNVDVMTRNSDDFTNGLAERVAGVIARFWEGTREEN